VDDFARQYASLTGTDLYQDVLLVEVGGSIVGYSRVEHWDAQNQGCTYVHTCYLVAECRGQGVERTTLRWGEQRAQELAADNTSHGPCFVASFATDRAPEREQLLRRESYTPVWHDYVMVRPQLDAIPDVPLPTGLVVRPVQEDQLRAIWEAEVEAFRGAAAQSDTASREFERWLDQPNFQPDRWQVAWDGGEIAGMIRNFINVHENATFGRRRGYTEQISVRLPWRRRGLARALLTRSLRLLREWGMTEAALGVNSANATGATQLYESVGFHVDLRQTLYRKPLARAGFPRH
jgi:GNAT superfamily N-acetyltransferase